MYARGYGTFLAYIYIINFNVMYNLSLATNRSYLWCKKVYIYCEKVLNWSCKCLTLCLIVFIYINILYMYIHICMHNRERNIWREKYIKGKATIRQRSLISHLLFIFLRQRRENKISRKERLLNFNLLI